MSQLIIEKLDKLAELRLTEEAIKREYEKKKENLLAKVKPKLDDLDVQYIGIFDKARTAVENLESDVREDVLALGESVKGKDLHAVYNKGRVTWDSKGLDGYAVGQPKILAFRKEGVPSVSIREVQK